ncbi:hypothetical protein [Agrobacterium tumefaciens]|uniref:Uncharacterized protein n=1 Tax=Agrobacterium tumefaciens TaxID=358 RepID=A0A176WYK4_AGRTU|nr:hypothetical protein [Agrobacterium tumefaciens]OAE37647.1 hypothetical protein A7J57_08700 [Agrobacterium tumefaciens]
MLRNLIPSVLRPREQDISLKSRATAVAVLQENPAYLTAREEILRDIVEKWLGSKPDAKELRESLYCQAHALSQVDAQLSVILAKNAMKDKHNAG